MNYLIALGALFTLGCTPSRSLFVSMHNPNTNTTLNCSARETRGVDTEILYDAVDACVRQLEARGFVRVDSPGPGKQPIPNKPSPPGS
ncbi:MAG TPA: hypothetical protein VE616_15380 [Candidatus Udaeobacter sp.]|nr:hypothetical protein [Candidatus Udaeobacter sp.]